MAAELIERIGAIVQGVAGVIGARIPVDELREELRGALVALVRHRPTGKTVERVGGVAAVPRRRRNEACTMGDDPASL